MKFWCDTWCGDQPLQDNFPDLFRLARVPDASVANHLQLLGSSHHWDVVFSRHAQDWELEIVSTFMELLYSYPIRRGSLDEMCWRPSSQKTFTVRFYYSLLSQPSRSFFPWKSIWKAKVPNRVAFFTWTTALERILTVDNLRKRRVIIIDWCCMCKVQGETVNHLLLHCTVAQELWSLIFVLFGITWVMPRGVVDLLMCWSERFGKSEAGAIWKAIPHCLMWCIWREQNSRVFVGEELSIPALKSSFLQTLYNWLKASNLVSCNSLAEMLDRCAVESFIAV